MRKHLFLVLLLSLTVAWMAGCGSSPKKIQQPTVPNIAFLQGPADYSYMFSPMLGTFSTSGATTTFTTSTVIDTTTNQPISAEIYSIILSKDRGKAAFDLYGGMDGISDQWDIWVANLKNLSANPVQISNDTYDDGMPQFSPDGSKVVYASYRPVPWDEGGYQWQIVIRSSSGIGTEQVLPIPLGIEYQMAPTFSPDGTKIAMHAAGYLGEQYFYGIMVTNADGSNPVVLSNPSDSETCYYCADELPSYTSDGTKIVFSRENWMQSPEVEDIYIMNASDGSGATKLSDSVGLNSDPQMVSLDAGGEKILFNSNRDNLGFDTGAGFCLYMMNLDGTGLTRLTNNTLFDGFSGWWYEGPNIGTVAARHSRAMTRAGHALYQGRTPAHGWRQ